MGSFSSPPEEPGKEGIKSRWKKKVNLDKVKERLDDLALFLVIAAAAFLAGIVLFVLIPASFANDAQRTNVRPQARSSNTLGMATATATPLPDYGEELERELIESISYRRMIDDRNGVSVSASLAKLARVYLRDQNYITEIEIRGKPKDCDITCTFTNTTFSIAPDIYTTAPDFYSITFTLLEIRTNKEDFLEDSLDILTNNIESHAALYKCNVGFVGAAVKAVTQRKYLLVLVFGNLNKDC